jgi:hypothetical protein
MNRNSMCDMIRTYIHEHKGVWIDIAEPDTPEREELFQRAFLVALTYYATKHE